MNRLARSKSVDQVKERRSAALRVHLGKSTNGHGCLRRNSWSQPRERALSLNNSCVRRSVRGWERKQAWRAAGAAKPLDPSDRVSRLAGARSRLRRRSAVLQSGASLRPRDTARPRAIAPSGRLHWLMSPCGTCVPPPVGGLVRGNARSWCALLPRGSSQLHCDTRSSCFTTGRQRSCSLRMNAAVSAGDIGRG